MAASIILCDGAGDNEMVVVRTFNNNGQVETITNVDNQVDTYTYNNWGQIKLVEYGNANNCSTDDSSNSNIDNRTEYFYDAVGRMDEMTDYRADADNNTVVNSVTTTWSYDDLSRVNQYVQDGSEVTYEYNAVSQVNEVTYMSDVTLGQSSPTTTLGYAYDGYGRLSSITKDSDTARTYTYTTCGFKVDYMTDYLELDTNSAAQMQTDYTYNSLGLVSGISYIDTAPATDVTKESYAYTYDDRGYILTETLNTNYSGTNTVNKSYTYDGIGRLKTSTEGSTTTTYTYDKVGNRLSESDGTTTLDFDHYNEFNQLTEIDIISGGTTYEYMDYTYNTRGGEATQIETLPGGAGTEVTTYTYDAAGNLNKTDDGTDITKHFYNGNGQRLKKEENSSITNYYYSGSAVLFTTDAYNAKLTENILTPSGSVVASQRFTGAYEAEYYFFNYDIRQSVTSIVDDSFTLMQGYEYDDFGNKTVTGDTGFLNEVTFTGAVADSTGLYYMNARFYNPNTGRFLTQDSYTGNAYEPMSQHLYSYTGNNPINYVDPTGHFAIPPFLVIVAVVVIVAIVLIACPIQSVDDTVDSADYIVETQINHTKNVYNATMGYDEPIYPVYLPTGTGDGSSGFWTEDLYLDHINSEKTQKQFKNYVKALYGDLDAGHTLSNQDIEELSKDLNYTSSWDPTISKPLNLLDQTEISNAGDVLNTTGKYWGWLFKGTKKERKTK